MTFEVEIDHTHERNFTDKKGPLSVVIVNSVAMYEVTFKPSRFLLVSAANPCDQRVISKTVIVRVCLSLKNNLLFKQYYCKNTMAQPT